MTMTLTILIGLVGSYVGGLVGDLLLGSPWGLLTAVAVAAFLVRTVDRRRFDRPHL